MSILVLFGWFSAISGRLGWFYVDFRPVRRNFGRSCWDFSRLVFSNPRRSPSEARWPEGVWEDKSRKVSTATSPKFRRTAGKNRKARPRKKVTHFFILFFKNDLLSLIRRLYENEPDPSIYISTNRGQTLHIFCKNFLIFFLQIWLILKFCHSFGIYFQEAWSIQAHLFDLNYF